MQQGQLWKRIGQLHQQYGPIVRIAPDELSIISPNIWSELYLNPRPPYRKDPYSQAQPLNGAHSLFTAEGDTHKRIRRHVISGVSDKVIREQSYVIEDYATQLTDRLVEEACGAENTVDMWKIYGDTTLDIITTLAIGESFLGDDGGEPSAEVESFVAHARFSTLMNSLSRWPLLRLGFIFVYSRLGAKLRLQTWRIGAAKTLKRMRMGHQMQPKQQIDFAAPILTRLSDNEKQGISPAEFQTNVLSWIFADSLLTTVALSTATYLLARHTSTLRHLQAEIRSKFESAREITVMAVQDLPYLNAVIKETLRIQHPTPITLPRVLQDGGLIDGYEIPPKVSSFPHQDRISQSDYLTIQTVIGTHLQAIQNSPLHWHDPKVFHPERFLSAEDPRYESRFEKDNKRVFQPFSTGPRNCVGAK